MSAGSDIPQQPQPGQQPPPQYAPPPYQPFQPAPPPRRANPWKWIVIGCGSLVLLSICGGVVATTGLIAALSGGGSSTAVAAPRTPVPLGVPARDAAQPATAAGAATVGDTATTRDYTMTVHELSDPAMTTGAFQPAAGKRYVALDVTITNTSGREVAYNPLYGKLRLADNTEVTTAIGGQEPSLKSGNLANGEAIRGWLTFEVPEGVAPATFVYEIIAFGSGGRITFNLR